MLKHFGDDQGLHSASNSYIVQIIHFYRLGSLQKLIRECTRIFFLSLGLIAIALPAFAQFEGQIVQVCDGSSASRIFATADNASSGNWYVFSYGTPGGVLASAANGEYVELDINFNEMLEIRDEDTNEAAFLKNVNGSNFTPVPVPFENQNCDHQLICSSNSNFDLISNDVANGFSNSNFSGIIGSNTLNDTHNGSFNAVIFGNFESIDGVGDSEGRLAIQNNFTASGGYTVGGGNPGGTGGLHAPLGWDNLIVGGDMDYPVAGGVRGNVLYNNNTGSSLPGFIGITGSGMYRNYSPDIDWNNSLTYLQTLSSNLSPSNVTIPHTEGIVSGSDDLTLDGEDNSGVLIFNISSLTAGGSLNFINISNAEAIVINIAGTAFTKTGGSILLNGSVLDYPPATPASEDIIEKTIWNFYEATDFNLSSFLLLGSVLAPFTEEVTLSGGSINGQTVLAGDVEQSGGFEFHNFCFTKSSFLVPEEETLTLTQRNCWRMLSSPFQSLSYNDIIGPLWTQGAAGSDSPPPETSAVNSNIFLWDKTQSGNSPSDWTTSGLDLNNGIPEGEGFLMSIFEDDNNDGTIQSNEEFDKEITVTGVPYSGTAVSPSMNQNNEGWTLVGNPFDEPIDFDYMINNGFTDELTDVAYVYNINASGSSNPNTNGNPGGWVSTNGSLGDLHDGKIAVFQGFFVQNDESVSNPSITFTDAARTSGATFYGKEKWDKPNFVRLELEGDRVQNSAWLSFSEGASSSRMKGDALELVPFKDEYALLASKKGEDLFDIGQFPNLPDTEIPLHIETTSPGTYSISATDLNLSSGINLIFKDNHENISIPVDENFNYRFTIDQAAKTLNGISELSCSSSEVEFAKAFTPNPAKATAGTANRFSVYLKGKDKNDIELPAEVALNQNYPNPFNPATVINYQLPATNVVLLEVYDLVGRKITTLVNGQVEAGTHSVNFDASNLSSGVYIYRLQTENQTLSRKLTVIK